MHRFDWFARSALATPTNQMVHGAFRRLGDDAVRVVHSRHDAATLMSPSDFTTMPWKNGKGSTLELAVAFAPDDKANFAWRLSRASVTSDGPFSNFPGIDRVLTVLPGGGGGLSLCVGDDTHIVRPFEPITFSGDDAASSKLLSGGLEDFNVMTRRGSARASVQAYYLSGASLRAGPTVGEADHSFLYCIEGEVEVLNAPGAGKGCKVPTSHALRMAWTDHARKKVDSDRRDGPVEIVSNSDAKIIWVDIVELWRAL